jgi:hypothetical protein
MSNVVVSLGGVPFQDFEVPERIAFGGAQRLAINQLIGGGRVVNALGVDDGEIVFSGIFSGSDAAGRVQALDLLRSTGTAVPFIWGEFFYIVVVAQFIVEYAKPWWIPFAVRCVVVTDPVAALGSAVAPLTNLISGDISNAVSFGGQSGISLAGLGTGPNGGYDAAITSIGNALSSGGGTLLANAASVSAAPDAATGVAAINGIQTSSSQIAALSAMRGYVSRAARNAAGGSL